MESRFAIISFKVQFQATFTTCVVGGSRRERIFPLLMIQQRALWFRREQGFFRRPAEEEFYQGAKCRKRKGAGENKQGCQNKRLQSKKKSHLLKCRSELAYGSGTQNSNDERHPSHVWDMEVNRFFSCTHAKPKCLTRVVS